MKILYILVLLNLSLYSHSLKIFTTKEADFISVKSYFSASSPCKDCEVVVKGLNGDFTCKTDNKGMAKIPLKINPTNITVNASLGHKNSIQITPYKQEIQKKEYPFWLKILFGLGVIFVFFGALKFLGKK